MPDIQSLSLKIEELSGSVNSWNNAMIISLVFSLVEIQSSVYALDLHLESIEHPEKMAGK